MALTHPLAAQDLSGTYVFSTQAGDSLTLTLAKDSAGITHGRVTGRETDIQLSGRRRAGGLAGPTTSLKGPGYFSAALRGTELDLVLADVNERGAPRFDTARQFVLTRRVAPDASAKSRTLH
jgi:hypothetical protein